MYNAPTPKEAKQIAAQLKTEDNSERLADWAKIKTDVMAYILKVKWNNCGKFRQALMQTEGMVIAEATACAYWGVGVAPNLAQHTKPSKFLGQNHMGKLQMALRDYVTQTVSPNEGVEVKLPPKPVYGYPSQLSPFRDPQSPDTNQTEVTPPIQMQPTDMHVLSATATPLDHPDIKKGADTPPPPSSDNEHNSSHSISTPTKTLESRDMAESAPVNPSPTIPPRKKRGNRSTTAKVNTLDNFVRKESPVVKRKLSSEAGSPSSVQVAKSTRTDGADDVS